jgi:ABC-type branched-subunit amino acid transport system substrate-binding protein
VGGAGGCTTNAECVERGASEPYRCRHSDRRCVKLKTDECPLVYGPFKDPNAVYFGSFAALSVEQPSANSVVWATRLALDELNAEGGGLPGGPDGAPRPLVMLVCNNDTAVDADIVTTGAAHLADDVGVSALLATLKPDDLRAAFEAELENDILFLSPVTLTSVLADEQYPDSGLIWNLLGQPLDFAPAYAKLLAELETHLRAERALPDPEASPLKVALVSSEEPFNAELQTFVYSRLIFNGKGAAVNRDEGHYLGLSLGDSQAELQQAADEIIAFAPDIVVSTAGDAVTQPDGIVQLVEEGWAASGVGQRPYFILSPDNAGNLALVRDLIEVFKRNVDANTDRRYLGVSAAAASDPTLQNGYAERLRTRFPDAITDTGNYYDAVYLLAYAMRAAEAPLSGPKLVAAMPRLFHGAEYGVGPDDIANVYTALEEPEATITLDGTLGPPDFDEASGVRRATPSVFCFEATQTSLTLRVDVLRYDSDMDEFTGTYPCMPNFPEP